MSNAIDFLIRICSVVILCFFWLPMLFFLCAMGSDSGTEDAISNSLWMLSGGLAVIAGLIWASLMPSLFESWLPENFILKKIVVRGPAYLIAIFGGYFWLSAVNIWPH